MAGIIEYHQLEIDRGVSTSRKEIRKSENDGKSFTWRTYKEAKRDGEGEGLGGRVGALERESVRMVEFDQVLLFDSVGALRRELDLALESTSSSSPVSSAGSPLGWNGGRVVHLPQRARPN